MDHKETQDVTITTSQSDPLCQSIVRHTAERKLSLRLLHQFKNKKDQSPHGLIHQFKQSTLLRGIIVPQQSHIK